MTVEKHWEIKLKRLKPVWTPQFKKEEEEEKQGLLLNNSHSVEKAVKKQKMIAGVLLVCVLFWQFIPQIVYNALLRG